MSALFIMALIGCVVLGVIAGGAYFGAIWRSAELFTSGDRLPTAIALVAGRFALILVVLATVAIRGGALPLLATAVGIAVARLAVMRRLNATAP